MLLLSLAAAILSFSLAAPGESVLRGLDPVELCAGRETPGLDTSAVEHGGFRYVFASDENRQRFAADPERWGIQLGGGCGRMGPLSGSCSDQLFAVHDGRIYIFASDACRASFVKSPSKFVDRDDAPLFEGAQDAADAERGRALLARVLDGLGGAERVDAVRALRLETRGEAGGLQLPHAREVSLDGTRDASVSGACAALEVDPEIPATDFALSR